MSQTIVYCMDSSTLIDLGQTYPRRNFPGLWDELSVLVRDGRLVAPREVLKEVKKDYELGPWIKKNGEMFVRLISEELDLVREVVAKFPDLIDPSKETPDADPFLIALAVARNRQAGKQLFPCQHVVLTSERPTKARKPKIPDVCKAFGVECISGARAITQFIETEGWTFPSSRVNGDLRVPREG